MTNELLDVRRRMIYIKSLANFIREKGWEPQHRWRFSLLLKAIDEEVELLAEEVSVLEASL